MILLMWYWVQIPPQDISLTGFDILLLPENVNRIDTIITESSFLNVNNDPSIKGLDNVIRDHVFS